MHARAQPDGREHAEGEPPKCVQRPGLEVGDERVKGGGGGGGGGAAAAAAAASAAAARAAAPREEVERERRGERPRVVARPPQQQGREAGRRPRGNGEEQGRGSRGRAREGEALALEGQGAGELVVSEETFFFFFVERGKRFFDSATTAVSDVVVLILSLLFLSPSLSTSSVYLFYPLLFSRGKLRQDRSQLLGSRSDRGHLELVRGPMDRLDDEDLIALDQAAKENMKNRQREYSHSFCFSLFCSLSLSLPVER